MMPSAAVELASGTTPHRVLALDLRNASADLQTALRHLPPDTPGRCAADRLARLLDRALPLLDPHLPAPETLAMDEARFFRLLEMAGSDTGPELVDRLQSDLLTVESALQRALPEVPPDWAEIRAQTHVLVALAGAVGAIGLQHLAEEMNSLAHRQDGTAIAAREAPLFAGLSALLRFVAQQKGGAS